MEVEKKKINKKEDVLGVGKAIESLVKLLVVILFILFFTPMGWVVLLTSLAFLIT